MHLKRTKKLIEKRRTDINELYEKGFYDNNLLNDDVLLKKSRKLDELLNKYDRMITRLECLHRK